MAMFHRPFQIRVMRAHLAFKLGKVLQPTVGANRLRIRQGKRPQNNQSRSQKKPAGMPQWQSHALLLSAYQIFVNYSAFHDKRNMLENRDILHWIAWDCNEVSK